MPIETLEADVVVVGGGIAGSLAVLGAAEQGARVVVCDKGGRIERCGSAAGGIDHFLAILEEGPEWDTPEYLLRHIPAVTEGIVDLAVAARVAYGLKDMVRYLEKIGVDFHDPEAPPGTRYHRHRAFGLPGEYHINFDGRNFKVIIGHAARRTVARVLERVMVVDVLMEDGQPKGVVAFHIRKGTLYIILAPAIVLATGDANRLGLNASGNPFDSWHLPYNTGDGHAIATRAGAWLANMEFTDSTVTPKGYSTQGLNAFTGGGAYLVNALGERFMFKYHPAGERARRSDLVRGVVTEIVEGRGPVYCDCTHLPEEELHRLVSTLGVDRPALPDYFAQKGIDLTKEPFEVTVSELAIVRGGALFRGAGILIDANCASTVPGIFAAGECATTSAAAAGAAVTGYIAGKSAARYALGHRRRLRVSSAEVKHIETTVMQPLRLDDGLTYRQFEDRVRQIVTFYVGYRREEERLRRAVEKLHALRELESKMRARDFHDLMRVYEARNIRTVAEALARSALERRESRGGHFRIDYPHPDYKHGQHMILVRQTEDGMDVSFRDTHLPPTPLPSVPEWVKQVVVSE